MKTLLRLKVYSSLYRGSITGAGWYYLSISAAKSRVSVQSSWIELLPEVPEV
jgi:hypothetical protein